VKLVSSDPSRLPTAVVWAGHPAAEARSYSAERQAAVEGSEEGGASHWSRARMHTDRRETRGAKATGWPYRASIPPPAVAPRRRPMPRHFPALASYLPAPPHSPLSLHPLEQLGRVPPPTHAPSAKPWVARPRCRCFRRAGARAECPSPRYPPPLSLDCRHSCCQHARPRRHCRSRACPAAAGRWTQRKRQQRRVPLAGAVGGPMALEFVRATRRVL